jgi:formylglycine-generating enzyme required for sulfatase activity
MKMIVVFGFIGIVSLVLIGWFIGNPPAVDTSQPTPASTSNKPGTRPNQAGMEFILIPSGSFVMGSNNADAEKPVHRVAIAQPFYMGKYEVTQAQWQAVIGNNPSYFKDCGGNCPVENVSWEDTQAFIDKLNTVNDGFTYRLPSEAEWEYACRGGTAGDYYGAVVDEIAWYGKNSGTGSHSVGGKQPNAFGLYDMSGNVWEWCQDWYHESYSRAPTNGAAWLSGGELTYRVRRGGSWNDIATSLRSANRNDYQYGTPYYHNYNEGFRLVAVARTQ